MNKRYLLFSLAALFISATWFMLSSSTDGVVGHYYSAGAALSGLDRTGGPFSGGATCAACHGGGSGTTSISFTLKNASNVAVTSYLPGASYTAEFQVTSSMAIKGFQGLALKSGNLQGGSFTTVLTPQSQISTLGGRQYPEHQGGTNSSGTFKFTWVAPVVGTGSITFYAVGNGVNGLGSPAGDVPSLPISVVITEGNSTTISYPVTQVCNNGANQPATIAGTTGGTFTASPAGLSINPTTGLINVAGSSPGQYTITYTFAGGSTTKTMKINPLYNISNTASICQGESIFLAGANQTTAGVYTSNFQSVAGCDSVVVTTLTVKQPSSSTINASTCTGDSILVGGQYVSTNGQSTIVIPNSVGCDSTITVNLTLNPVFSTTTFVSICDGESYLFNGSVLTTTGVYTNNGQTINGCDSSATLNLTVNSVNTSVTNNGSSLTAQASGASYTWLDCNNNFAVVPGATSQTFSPTLSGDFAVRVVEQTCVDTSACETVVLFGIDEMKLAGITLYPNPSSGEVNLSFNKKISAEFKLFSADGKLIFSEYFESKNQYKNSFDLEPGNYIVQVKEADKVSRSLWIVQ